VSLLPVARRQDGLKNGLLLPLVGGGVGAACETPPLNKPLSVEVALVGGTGGGGANWKKQQGLAQESLLSSSLSLLLRA
jgi:hypothetical protein